MPLTVRCTGLEMIQSQYQRNAYYLKQSYSLLCMVTDWCIIFHRISFLCYRYLWLWCKTFYGFQSKHFRQKKQLSWFCHPNVIVVPISSFNVLVNAITPFSCVISSLISFIQLYPHQFFFHENKNNEWITKM